MIDPKMSFINGLGLDLFNPLKSNLLRKTQLTSIIFVLTKSFCLTSHKCPFLVSITYSNTDDEQKYHVGE